VNQRLRNAHQRQKRALRCSLWLDDDGQMDKVRELEQMIEALRRQRESCEPKSNQNPRYLRYSNAVSALRWIIDDIRRDDSSS
jgi:hypothetical protein